MCHVFVIKSLGLSLEGERKQYAPRKHKRMARILSSLRNKRPGLSGRPPCKGVATGVARSRGIIRHGTRSVVFCGGVNPLYSATKLLHAGSAEWSHLGW